MALTLSVIAGIALLLPGLFGVLTWNQIARRHIASRPDLPLTAISVLTFSVALSIFAHVMAWILFDLVLRALVGIGDELPAVVRSLPSVIAEVLTSDGQLDLRPVVTNPIETMISLARGAANQVTSSDIFLAAGAILFESLMIVGILMDDGFDVGLDGVDLSNQGWVYTHVVRPARNGYRPVAYVLTTLQKDGLGIGYSGVVADIRQSDRGETLAISLNEPERFLFELKPGKDAGRYGSPASPPTFRRYADKFVGGVVALDARVIHNIVISNPSGARLKRLSELVGPEADEAAEPLPEVDDA